MYQGSNLTAVESMDAIADAFEDLLRTNSFAEITVKELCAHADRSRQTFYQLFSSKEDILAWRFENLFAEFSATLPDTPTLHTLTLAFFRYWRAHASFLGILADNQLYHLMGVAFEGFLVKIEGFAEAVRGIKNEAYIASGVAGLLANLLLRWHADGYALDEEVLASLAEDMLRGCIFNWE